MITGKEIQDARMKRGLSLRQLADLAGIPHTTIYRAETEGLDNIRFGYVLIIASKLGLTIPQMEAKNRVQVDLLDAINRQDYALALRIIAALVEEN